MKAYVTATIHITVEFADNGDNTTDQVFEAVLGELPHGCDLESITVDELES